MKRKLLTGIALVTGPLFWASAATADIITSGGSAGTVSFTKNASGTVDFSTAGFTSAPAEFQSPNGTTLVTGTLAWGAMSGTTGIQTAGVFPISPAVTESITFTATSGASGTMTGTASWPGIKDDTTTPQFDVNATFTVSTNAVTNATFMADFVPGSVGSIDFTVNLPDSTTLTNLAADASVTGTFSSGEIVPGAVSTPEPASLTVLGSALVGLGWLARRRRKLM